MREHTLLYDGDGGSVGFAVEAGGEDSLYAPIPAISEPQRPRTGGFEAGISDFLS